jgi:O-Antigen ligase
MDVQILGSLPTELIAWIACCFALSILLRRRPAILVAISLVVWAAVPAVAGSVVTGIASGSLSLAPSTWLVVAILVVQVLYDVRAILWEIGHRILVYLALFLVILVAFLATKTSPGGSGLVLFADQIAAPVTLFMIVCIALRARPADMFLLRNTIIGVATAESVLAIVQYSTHSIIFYRSYFLTNYWFNEVKFDRWMGTIDQPLALSFLVCVAVPLVAGMRQVWLQTPILILMAIGVVITQSRTGVAVVGLGIVYVIVRSRIPGIAKVLSLVAMSVVGYFVFSSSLIAGVAGRVEFDEGSAAARQDALNYFFNHWLDYFFTGGGISFSYRFAELGGLETSLESAILMYAIDIGVVFSLLYFGVQLVIVLRSALRPGCPGLFLAGVLAIVIPQTYSSLATNSIAGALLWIVLGMAASLPRRAGEEFEDIGEEMLDIPEPVVEPTAVPEIGPSGGGEHAGQPSAHRLLARSHRMTAPSHRMTVGAANYQSLKRQANRKRL